MRGSQALRSINKLLRVQETFRHNPTEENARRVYKAALVALKHWDISQLRSMS